LTSLERLDGIQIAKQMAARNTSNPTRGELEKWDALQLRAIVHNAAACARNIEASLALVPSLNLVWKQLQEKLDAGKIYVADLRDDLSTN
jgi:hypothetical protein